MANFLVTGGAGFIGSNLVAKLVEQGQKVRVLDNFSTGRRKNIVHLLDKIELIEGDLRDLEMVRESVSGVDYVLHQGALPSVPRSVADPVTTSAVNVTGTMNVLVASRDAKVKRVVYASSSSVYGDVASGARSETQTPNPLSPYAAAKLAGEYYCQVFYKVYGLETVCLRYFNVFGPHQDPNSQYAAVIPKFITAILENRAPVIYGDGQQSRDFTYVENVVQANLLAAQQPQVAGQVFNIACGENHNLLALVNLINRFLGKNIEPRFEAPRISDIKHSLADISRAQQGLNYRVLFDFEDGLKKTVRWYTDF